MMHTNVEPMLEQRQKLDEKATSLVFPEGEEIEKKICNACAIHRDVVWSQCKDWM